MARNYSLFGKLYFYVVIPFMELKPILVLDSVRMQVGTGLRSRIVMVPGILDSVPSLATTKHDAGSIKAG